MTWADFVEWLLASVLLDGNALAEIVTDERVQVTALSQFRGAPSPSRTTTSPASTVPASKAGA